MERRQAVRAPMQKAGLMAFEDGSSYPCIVKNLSPRGAKISLLRSQELTDEFSLAIEGTRSRVRAIWRTRFHVGVRFIGSVA
jgi:hypothetical protein